MYIALGSHSGGDDEHAGTHTMNMFFDSNGTFENILFASWKADSSGKYVLSIFIVVAMGVLFEFVRHVGRTYAIKELWPVNVRKEEVCACKTRQAEHVGEQICIQRREYYFSVKNFIFSVFKTSYVLVISLFCS